MTTRSGRQFLQIPGPSNVPDSVLRAIDRPTIDHRGPEFRELTQRLLSGLQKVFNCRGPVIIFPSSGSGAWEAALVNTLSPGDSVLMVETGHFAGFCQGSQGRQLLLAFQSDLTQVTTFMYGRERNGRPYPDRRFSEVGGLHHRYERRAA